MIYWFKPLPHKELSAVWQPFISSPLFRRHFMKAVYPLMLLFAAVSFWYSRHVAEWDWIFLLPLFLLHEICHFIIIYQLGDVSITRRGFFFWMNTNAEMTKHRFLLFVSMPTLILSLLPLILSLLFDGTVSNWLILISLANLTIASADVVNIILILRKPAKAVFCCGHYKFGTKL